MIRNTERNANLFPSVSFGSVAAIYEQYDRELLEGKHLFPRLGRWYFATASRRMEPSFFIIGTQKGGTTSLAQYLIAHPQVITPQRKDIYFFNNPVNFAKGRNWYKAHFALNTYKRLHEKRKGVKHAVTFDPTPNYFVADGAAERLKRFYPDTQLILLLRNPVDRAWSNYRMCRFHEFENLSFEDALRYEESRIAAEKERMKEPGYHSYVMQRLCYRAHGLYVNYLREWLKHFHRDQLLVLKSEDLFEDPAAIYREVLQFTGLDPYENLSFEVFNKGKIKEGLPSKTRKELSAFYKPYNQALYDLIGRDMNWD
jgi:hypothetical protein